VKYKLIINKNENQSNQPSCAPIDKKIFD
jgi:hypothetical protein